jgi:hypothetical protein
MARISTGSSSGRRPRISVSSRWRKPGPDLFARGQKRPSTTAPVRRRKQAAIIAVATWTRGRQAGIQITSPRSASGSTPAQHETSDDLNYAEQGISPDQCPGPDHRH